MALSTSLFKDISCISSELVEVLNSLGFVQATPVQEAVIPLFCGHKDVAVDACTGSGKTLAFVVPVVEKLKRLEEKLKKHQVGAVILSPTRELARQSYEVACPLLAVLPNVRVQLMVGGTDVGQDVQQFLSEGGQVIIGTPGRVDDIMKRCAAMDLKKLEVLVLDEADRLLDMGFKAQIDNIIARLPRQRRTGLFSATQTEAVEALTRAGLRNPVRVNVAVSAAEAGASKKTSSCGLPEGATQKTPQSLQLHYVVCEAEDKIPQLVKFLQTHKHEKVIVYFLTCMLVDYIALVLPRLKEIKDLNLVALHGRMKQSVREATLNQFRDWQEGCLLCTDLAARGLDIPDVQWILQYDPPQDPAAFIHRVGRTARMGRSGNALVFLLPHEVTYVELMRLRKVPLEEGCLLPEAPQVQDRLRREAETDREVMEKGTRAFVSYVRGYKEHHCKFIFRLADLQLGHLAMSLGLLRMPRMPEIKKAPSSLQHFVESSVDPDSVKYKDKAREKNRQKLMREKQDKQNVKLEVVKNKAKAPAQEATKKLPAAKRRLLQDRDDLMELTHDYSLLKKLKKGKISEQEFDHGTGILTADESSADIQRDLSDDDDDDDDKSELEVGKTSGSRPRALSAGLTFSKKPSEVAGRKMMKRKKRKKKSQAQPG